VNAVRDAAIDVNDTVKNTVNTVTTTAVNVNDTVQNTVDIVKVQVKVLPTLSRAKWI